MRILITIIGLLFILTSAVSSSQCEQNFTPGNRVLSAGSAVSSSNRDAVNNLPGMKAERGIKNILFGWTDIPRSILQVTRDSRNPIWGATAGAFKGIGKAVPRTVSGAVDVLSFPLADYNKQLVKPDEWNTGIQ